MLEEMRLTGGDIVTMSALVVAALGLVINVWRSSRDDKRSDSADVERIVRIDENSRETRADVADIKAELRSVRNTIGDHERRIIKLEETSRTQWMRIDEIKDKAE
ncbi:MULTISPECIES: hypothetical protein [Gordonibacter]|uniref:Uncharacterized protein n=1 Tax=Gordonibacter faecis TaxID=3047475 RepID=A0ABT7DSN3_9ACTN|nr:MULTISPECIES: hypothetical protein [unclassified Gordonibacter]MDJ1651618.1 hypothetical protein [Gordonibacter sp. KGMB12511]HIW77040.1 hypothetical protein [Candidatus Gordonibacter avicola]